MPCSVYISVSVYFCIKSSTDESPEDRLTTLLSEHKTSQVHIGKSFPFLLQLLLCKLNIPYDTNSNSKCSENFIFDLLPLMNLWHFCEYNSYTSEINPWSYINLLWILHCGSQTIVHAGKALIMCYWFRLELEYTTDAMASTTLRTILSSAPISVRETEISILTESLRQAGDVAVRSSVSTCCTRPDTSEFIHMLQQFSQTIMSSCLTFLPRLVCSLIGYAVCCNKSWPQVFGHMRAF